MKAPEEIFNHHASKIMKQFELEGFKRTYPTLFKAIIESMKSMQSDYESELLKLRTMKHQSICEGIDSELQKTQFRKG